MKIRKIFKNINRFGSVELVHESGRGLSINKVKDKFVVEYSHTDLSLELDNRNHLKRLIDISVNEAGYVVA